MIKRDNWETIKGVEWPEHPGDFRKVFSGEKVMMVRNEVTPPSVPLTSPPKLHHHTNEQLIYVLQGTGTSYVGDESFEVKAGSVILIPPNVPHGLNPRGNEKMYLLEIFSPIREDYLI